MSYDPGYTPLPPPTPLSDKEHVLWREAYLLALSKGNDVAKSTRIADGSVCNLRRAPGRISRLDEERTP